jgi:hypothetical protein
MRMTEEDPSWRISLEDAYNEVNEAFEAEGAHRMSWPIIPSGITISQWIGYTALGIRHEFVHYQHTVLRAWAHVKAKATTPGEN